MDARDFCEDIGQALEDYECSDEEEKLERLEETVGLLASLYCEINMQYNNPDLTTVNVDTSALEEILGLGNPQPPGIVEEVADILGSIE